MVTPKSLSMESNTPASPFKNALVSARRTAHISSVICPDSLPVYAVLSSPISTAKEASQQSLQLSSSWDQLVKNKSGGTETKLSNSTASR